MKARMIIDAMDKSSSKWYVQETWSMPSVIPSEPCDTTVWTNSSFLRISVRSSRRWRSSDDIPSSVNLFVDKEELAYTPSVEEELRQKQMHEAVPRQVSKKNSQIMEIEKKDRSKRRLQNPPQEGSGLLSENAMENEEFLESQKISTKGNGLGPNDTRDSDEIWMTNTFSETSGKDNVSKISATEKDISTESHNKELSEDVYCNTQPGFKINMKTLKPIKDLPKVPCRKDQIVHCDDEHIYSQIPCRPQMATEQEFSKESSDVADDSPDMRSKCYGPKPVAEYDIMDKMNASICLEGHMEATNRMEQWANRDEPIYALVPHRSPQGNSIESDNNQSSKATEGNTCLEFKGKMNVDKLLDNFQKVQSGVKQPPQRDDEPVYSQLPARLTVKVPNCTDNLVKCNDDTIYVKVPVPFNPPLSVGLPDFPSNPQPMTSTSFTSNILADGQISRRLKRGDIAFNHEEFVFPGKSPRETKPTSQSKVVQDSTVVVDSAYQKYLQDMMNSL
ncbi:uncharacterized protein LOC135471749 isoform X2 [Liolophura sinensis]